MIGIRRWALLEPVSFEFVYYVFYIKNSTFYYKTFAYVLILYHK